MSDVYRNEIENRTRINLPFWKTRIFCKNILKKKDIRNVSYCKRCGIDVRDFTLSDNEWNNVIRNKYNIVCYNCYKDLEYLKNSQ